MFIPALMLSQCCFLRPAAAMVKKIPVGAAKVINVRKFTCVEMEGYPNCICNDGYVEDNGNGCIPEACEDYCLHGSCSLEDGQPYAPVRLHIPACSATGAPTDTLRKA
jgi:hypothetical protein